MNYCEDVKNDSDVWMSHSDTIVKLPESFAISAVTHTISYCSIQAGKWK